MIRPRPHRRTFSRRSAVVLALGIAVLPACAETTGTSPTGPALLEAGAPSLSRSSQVSICHRTGNGTYRLITVNGNALPAHQAHGDVAVGAPVPLHPVAVFDENCVPQIRETVLAIYELVTVNGETLPIVESGGSVMASQSIVLFVDGSCVVHITGREDVDSELGEVSLTDCTYVQTESQLSLMVDEGEGDGPQPFTGELDAEGGFTATNPEATYVYVRVF